MSQISDEIIDLIIKSRLEDLKKVKGQLSEDDYEKSRYNIISSKDNDSLELEEALNQIKDNKVLSIVISGLKKKIDEGKHNYLDGNGQLDVGHIVKDIEEIQVNNLTSTKKNIMVGEMTNVALTAAILHDKANNFDNLSREEQNEVIKNWSNLTSEDRLGIIDNLSSYFQENSDEYTPKENEIIGSAIETSKKAENINNISLDGFTNEEILETINVRLASRSEAEKKIVTDMLKSKEVSYQDVWNYLNGGFELSNQEVVQLLTDTRNGEKLNLPKISACEQQMRRELIEIVEYWNKLLQKEENPEKRKELEKKNSKIDKNKK